MAVRIAPREQLKQQIQSALNLPHGGSGSQGRDGAERRAAQARSRLPVVGMVGHVEKLAAELQLESLPDLKVLEQREIEIREARTADGISSGIAIAEGIRRRRHEGGGVEVLVNRASGSQLGRGGLVGTAGA